MRVRAESQTIRIALAGNPNSGKTSVFNAITGTHQHVGNYPGVTVEKKEGHRQLGRLRLEVTDLPGIYSLSAYSDEELVARDQLFDAPPDVVVCVVDASNIERNLYLAVQLAEMGLPMVVALNMVDVAASRGIHIDEEELAKRLGVQVVRTLGHKGDGVDELLEAVRHCVSAPAPTAHPLVYDDDIEERIARVVEELRLRNGDFTDVHRRWLAIKLIEKDATILARFAGSDLVPVAQASGESLSRTHGQSPEIVFSEARYGAIETICDGVVEQGHRRRTKTDRVDALVTHRVLGIPIFLGLMFGVFQLTFALGDPLMTVIENGFVALGGFIDGLWPAGSNSVLRSLIIDGMIGGVGGVLVFLPNILLLFLCISILESSGYMSRAAFIMDRLMRKIGLEGKSFIPMLIGFGCSVPAIMATRTLRSRRDRLTTMLVVPLVSCSARLPIYLLIIPAFFPQAWHAPMLWTVYVIGILVAVVAAKLLRTTVFRGESSPFLMELPPYKVPTLKAAVLEMWERARVFIKKAGTMILGVSIVLWALSSFPNSTPPEDLDQGGQALYQIEHSIAGHIGRAMEPAIRPMGFDWKIGTALIGAFAAKEVFVAQMGIVHSLGSDVDEESSTLRSRLRASYSPLVAFCIMLFTLISSPCMATVAVMKRESNSWRWAALQFWGLTLIAYLLTIVVFQIGSVLGLGA